MATKIKLSELENIITTAEAPMTAGEVVSEAFKNIPSSALEYGKAVVAPIADPIGTIKSISQLGLGIIQLAIPGEQPNEEQAKAVGQYFANRYGGLENLKKTIAKDPVGFLGDVSILLTGGGALASKAGPLQQVAQKVQKTGQVIDPFVGTAKLAGEALSPILGKTTGVGQEAIKEAYQAGRVGGQQAKEFREAITGKKPLEEIVETAKEGISVMADKRRSDYLKSKKGVMASQKQINFDPILAKADEIRKKFEFKGKTTLDKSGLNKLKEVEDAILDWSVNKQFHTIEGLDALKKKIDNLYPETDVFGKTAGKGAAVVGEMRDFINQQIKKSSPEYAKTMQAYEEAINLEKEIRKSLSLGDVATADTGFRKLLSTMNNNASTSFGIRLEKLKQLEGAGDISLRPSLAGTALSELTPRGLQGTITGLGLGLGGSYYFGPQYASILAASSPRLVGELGYRAGQIIPKVPAVRQLGILEEEIGQANETSSAIQDLLEQLQK